MVEIVQVHWSWKASGWLGLLAGLALGLWWSWHLPSAGYGGLFLAMGATLMPLAWEKVGVACKMLWIGMLFLLLAVEYRAIDNDRKESNAQLKKEFSELATTLSNQANENLKQILEGEHQSFENILKAQDKEFSTTMKAILTSERHDREDFARLLAKGEELVTQQQELYDFERGKLLPANDPMPQLCKNERLSNDQFVVDTGKAAWVTDSFPFNVLMVARRPIIALDKSEDGSVVVSVDIRTADNKILVLINKNGTIVNPRSGLLVSHDKHSLLIMDDLGNTVLSAKYLNKSAFYITGVLPYHSGTLSIMPSFFGGCMVCSHCINMVNID